MTVSADLAALVDRLQTARVLCVGDVMNDRFVYGSVERISPEAPIPVLRVQRETSVLGGAGNVLRNLVALGAETCFVTVIGNDRAGTEITHLIGAEQRVEPHLLVEHGRETSIKTRFVASNQQVLRADQETTAPIGHDAARDLLARAEAALADHAALILSDYGKGVLRGDVLDSLIRAAKAAGVPIIVDPKGRDYRKYQGATVVTPNRAELAEATGLPIDSDRAVIDAATWLLDRCDFAAVLVTRSQDGMTLVRKGQEPLHLNSVAREVYDVSGAGDTVVATLAAGLAAGIPIEQACALANAAAGVVVGKVGTAICRTEELVGAFHNRDLLEGESKILTRPRLIDQVTAWRRQGLKIGFTNGCFDLLHPGHVSLIRQARAACDRLVVGINTDASVKRLKGETRPVQTEMARAIVLASLAQVDAVTLFGEDTPLDLIRTLQPDVLVKGADYTVETVVGADIVLGNGGQVLLATLEPGQSTTSMIKRAAS